MRNLQTFATKVTRQSDKKSQKEKTQTIQVKSEKQLIDLLNSSKCPKALKPTKGKIAATLSKLNKEAAMNGEDVEWAIVDSGASIHGADASKHFPGIEPTPSKQDGLECTAANGGDMTVRGEQIVEYEVEEGHKCVTTFLNAGCELPIISVRKLTRDGNIVVFDKRIKGGYIKNLRTGKVTHFVEKDGIYFLKMILRRPKVNNSGFGRLGA